MPSAPSPDKKIHKDLLAWAEAQRAIVRAEVPAAAGAFEKYAQVLRRELGKYGRMSAAEFAAYQHRHRVRDLERRGELPVNTQES